MNVAINLADFIVIGKLLCEPDSSKALCLHECLSNVSELKNKSSLKVHITDLSANYPVISLYFFTALHYGQTQDNCCCHCKLSH